MIYSTEKNEIAREGARGQITKGRGIGAAAMGSNRQIRRGVGGGGGGEHGLGFVR